MGSVLVLLASADLFTNAVEWSGLYLKANQSSTGSVLAAVGTGLPEALIAVVAIAFGVHFSGVAVGIGAIVGAPFMLATLTLPLVGLAVMVRGGSKSLDLDPRSVAEDLGVFCVLFAIGAILSIAPIDRPGRVVVAVLLLLAYGAYVRRVMKTEGRMLEVPSRLRFHPGSDRPHLGLIAVQLGLSLATMLGASLVFVRSLSGVASGLGVSALVLSLVLTPVATELPEKLNSILWLARGKDVLAVGNVTGAMAFQSAVPLSVGLAFTNWHLQPPALYAMFLALIGTAFTAALVLRLRRLDPRWLMINGILYGLYLVYVFRVAL